MRDAPFEISYIRESSFLGVTGCVDDTKIDDFRAGLGLARSHGRRQDVVVDLTLVEHLPSVAVSALVEAIKQCATEGRRLRLVAAEGTIARRVLDVCALPVEDPGPRTARTRAGHR